MGSGQPPPSASAPRLPLLLPVLGAVSGEVGVGLDGYNTVRYMAHCRTKPLRLQKYFTSKGKYYQSWPMQRVAPGSKVTWSTSDLT
eukprot:CAMPEP_0114318358 /NCGR_PEP_ID=MMETSP0059-20121206/24546_1 /TAXON_ID=36894 /ORGANISM="Pyramimonas parkeae, Strain CCMP726" /LENGTH=85 /DNA_ID=CAMNT_0001445055 /DNA_START=14 /DNA_END=267 /DNA_ORIENTATION=-